MVNEDKGVRTKYGDRRLVIRCVSSRGNFFSLLGLIPVGDRKIGVRGNGLLICLPRSFLAIIIRRGFIKATRPNFEVVVDPSHRVLYPQAFFLHLMFLFSSVWLLHHRTSSRGL